MCVAMAEFRKSEYLCDAVVEASDGAIFKVHKIFLAAASPYFERMFHWKDCTESLPKVQVAMDSRALETIIDWIYSQEITFSSAFEAMQYLSRAKRIELPQLKEICQATVIEKTTSDNVFNLWQMARKDHLADIQEHCFSFVARNFHRMHETHASDYLSVPYDTFMALLETDRLVTAYEEDVYGLAKLKTSDPDLTEEERTSILKLVRFPLFAIGQETPSSLDTKLELMRHLQTSWNVVKSVWSNGPPQVPARDPISLQYIVVEKKYSQGIGIWEWNSRLDEVHERLLYGHGENVFVRSCSESLYRGKEMVIMVVKGHGASLYSNYLLAVDVRSWKVRNLPGIAHKTINPLRIVATEQKLYLFHDEFSRNVGAANFNHLIFLSSYNDDKHMWVTMRLYSLSDMMSPTIFSLSSGVFMMLETTFMKLNENTFEFEEHAPIPDKIRRRFFRWCTWDDMLIICGGCRPDPFATFQKSCNAVDLTTLTVSSDLIADMPNLLNRAICVSQSDNGLMAWYYGYGFSSNLGHLTPFFYCPKQKKWRPRTPKLNGLPLQHVHLARAVTFPSPNMGPIQREKDYTISSKILQHLVSSIALSTTIASSLCKSIILKK